MEKKREKKRKRRKEEKRNNKIKKKKAEGVQYIYTGLLQEGTNRLGIVVRPLIERSQTRVEREREFGITREPSLFVVGEHLKKAIRARERERGKLFGRERVERNRLSRYTRERDCDVISTHTL